MNYELQWQVQTVNTEPLPPGTEYKPILIAAFVMVTDAILFLETLKRVGNEPNIEIVEIRRA
jgi:hypothetical protein